MKKNICSVLLLFVCVFGLTACSGQDASNDSVIKLGINGEVNQIWKSVQATLKEEGIDLQFVTFSDYVIPNQALADGEIDANSFQTIAYFEQFIANHNLDLTSIGYTVLAPMGIYSAELEELSKLADGATVSIPNDESNGGRALKLLEDAGLIKVNPEAGITPTLKDITENPKNLKIVELVAQQLPLTLEDVDVAVINNGVAVQAGLSPLNDTLYGESTDSENAANYYNIIAVRSEDKDKELLQKLVGAYQTDATKEAIFNEYKGASIPVFE